MRVYAHQAGALKDLEKCRVNPDFNSAFRDDLEFYIPQLCSFFLKGRVEEPEELFRVLMWASLKNFYFAHRVWFFFHSAMFQEYSQQIFDASEKILQGLQLLCLTASPERLYVANSPQIAHSIVQLHMSDFYPAIHSDSALLEAAEMQNSGLAVDQQRKLKEAQYERMLSVQKIIREY